MMSITIKCKNRRDTQPGHEQGRDIDFDIYGRMERLSAPRHEHRSLQHAGNQGWLPSEDLV